MKRLALLIAFSTFVNLDVIAAATMNNLYIQNSFVHLKDFVSSHSSYSQTLMCGTPVELIKELSDHYQVRYDKKVGFIPKSSAVKSPAQCFQEKYPVFFQSLNIDNADLFYWGKLK